MIKRLATMSLTVFLIGLNSPSVHGQNVDADSLKDLSAVFVVVEDLPDDGRLGLSKDTIQTDVELKLRLAGMRVVTHEEGLKIPGKPAASISLAVDQTATLQRNGEVTSAKTWERGMIISHPTAQGVRTGIKDLCDQFLNDWLSVNPKK